MFKNNKTHFVAFFMAANLLLATGITVHAASLQQVLPVGQAIEENDGQSLVSVENVAETVVPKAETLMTEIEKQKAIVAEEAAKIKALEQYDQELLASIIFCEAGNQSYEGQVAVGAVVMNRIQSAKFPDTMEEVIYQSGQFVPAMTGWLDEVRASSGYTESAMKAAQDAIKGANPIGDCLFFDQGGYGYQIGAHYFH